jgi:hypothetical protein
MSVSGLPSNASSIAAAARFLDSPGVQFTRMQGSSLSSLFNGATGRPSDLNSFTSAAVAMPLYQHSGLLTGLTKWDGSMTPGSQRTPPAPAPSPTKAPMFTFNPFDRASWWSDPKGSTVDTTA